jgi:hypothetical protein
MQRNIDEVVASQERMLERMGRPGATSEKLKSALQNHLDKIAAWLAAQPHIETLPVDFAAVIASPREQSLRIDEFLGRRLNVPAMLEAVDPTLYRHRSLA